MSGQHDGGGIPPGTFQKLLRERILEKRKMTKEEFAMGRKQIQEMRSRTGVDPIEIFPTEIWKMITDELCPEDKRKMWELHEEFQDVMGKHRIRDILLPLILDIILDKNRPYFHMLGDSQNISEVCKSLKTRVNKIRDDVRECNQKNLEKLRKGVAFPLDVPREICSIQMYDQIFSGLESGFPPKALSINFFWFSHLGSNEEFRQKRERLITQRFDYFADKFNQLLKKRGNEILYINFHIRHLDLLERVGFTISKLYFYLQIWLTLMPNLRWFRLNCDLKSKMRGSRTGLMEITQLTKVFPLPKLPMLERVDVIVPIRRDEVLRIFDAILKENKTVTHVNFEGNLGMPELKHFCFPRLKNLPLTHVSLTGMDANIWNDELERFEPGGPAALIDQVKLALRHIRHLKMFKTSVNLENKSITSVFQILHQYPELEDVELKLENVKIGGEEEEIPFLQLPNLKTFSLNIAKPPRIDFSRNSDIRFFFSLQFLLYAKNLETIHWTFCFDANGRKELQSFLKENDDPDRLISFGGGWNNLSSSNKIWKIFPMLKVINIDIHELKGEEGSDLKHWVYKRGCERCTERKKKHDDVTPPYRASPFEALLNLL